MSVYVPHPELEDVIAEILGKEWVVSGFDMESGTDGSPIITAQLSTRVPEGGFDRLVAMLRRQRQVLTAQGFPDPAQEELG